MKRAVLALTLCVALSAVVSADFYFDFEQFLAPPGGLGALEATFGIEFAELVGDGFAVFGDLYYADDNLWLWGAPGKASEAGLSLSLRSPWNDAGLFPDYWQFDIDASSELHTKVANHFMRPEGSEVSFTLSAVFGNWALFVRATSAIDYSPFAWNLLPSFGVSGSL